MKIALASDSPVYKTGMSIQMMHIATHLIKNHDIVYYGWQSRKFERMKIGNKEMEIFPAFSNSTNHNEIFGKKLYPHFFNEYDFDLIITLGDTWMVDALVNVPNRPLWIMYYPVDGHPLNQNMERTISGCDIPVAMSYFGKSVTEKYLKNVDVLHIPHQIKYNVLSKYGKQGKQKKYRKEFNEKYNVSDDTFVFGSINRMNPRKHHERLFYAFSKFVHENGLTPDDVILFMQGDPFDPLYTSQFNMHDYFIIQYLEMFNIKDYVRFPKNYSVRNPLSDDETYRNMASIDVHVSATGGEGFGVSTLETMAVGKPNIITNYTTTPELLTFKTPYKQSITDKPRGIPVSYSLYMERSGVYKAWIDIDELKNSMKIAYDERDFMKEMGRNAQEYAKNYDSKNINKKWDEIMKIIDVFEVNGK